VTKEQVLQVKNLVKVYQSRTQGEVKAVDNVSFSIGQHEGFYSRSPTGHLGAALYVTLGVWLGERDLCAYVFVD